MNKILLFLPIFLISIYNCLGQENYVLEDNLVRVNYDIINDGRDSLIIKVNMINKSKEPIWINDGVYLFSPELRDKHLYINFGLDVNRYSLMDIVPFPLKKIETGDSCIVTDKIKKSSYDDIHIITDYLLESDYHAIIRKKKTPTEIGLNDYFRLMKFLAVTICR